LIALHCVSRDSYPSTVDACCHCYCSTVDFYANCTRYVVARANVLLRQQERSRNFKTIIRTKGTPAVICRVHSISIRFRFDFYSVSVRFLLQSIDCSHLFLSFNSIQFYFDIIYIMDPQLAALMASNMKKQAGRQEEEVILETAGDVQAGEKTKKKFKPPPGAQQLGMQAMLMQDANKGKIKLKKVQK
jgi:hypothetical protein